MKGLIFSIKRYSIHDGPGIRVTFFMKGCPLSCKWCHNPEGIKPQQESVISKHRIGEKEFEKEEKAGIFYTVKDVLNILEREQIFINKSNGGVTFSGGEPMMQSEFLHEVLKACKKEGYHTAIDTSGYSLQANYEAIMPFTDLFLFDIKHLDEKRHLEATGVSNSMILSNWVYLLANVSEINLRIPVIPGFNDDSDHIRRVIRFIIDTKKDSLKRINLLPFHRTGQSKYNKFNIHYRMERVEPPSKEMMLELRTRFLATGLQVKVGG